MSKKRLKYIQMKKITLIALAFMIQLVGCKKDNTTNTPQPTTLTFNITKSDGTSASGATVKLYSSLTDLANSTNQVGATGTANSSGKVTFSSNISAIKYYYLIENGCQTNSLGSLTTANPLTSNIENIVNIRLDAVGYLTIENTSSDPYIIYIDGAIEDTLAASDNSIYPLISGSHPIRAVQESGFLFTPTEYNFTSNITCGGTDAHTW